MNRLVIIFLSLVLLPSCIHFPYTPLQNVPRVAELKSKKPMWVICVELHADLVVETSWLLDHGCKLPKRVSSYKYVCLGWGDRIAYTQRWGWSDVPKALFWPTESIVQVVGFDYDIESTFPGMKIGRVDVPEVGGAELANFLNHSFSYANEAQQEPLVLRDSKWGDGHFIKSPYTYYFPRLCNQWVSTALRAAGVDTTKSVATMNCHTLIKSLEKYAERN